MDRTCRRCEEKRSPKSVVDAMLNGEFDNDWTQTETYDADSNEVFIPNEEVQSEFDRAIRYSGWEEVGQALSLSEKLQQENGDSYV